VLFSGTESDESIIWDSTAFRYSCVLFLVSSFTLSRAKSSDLLYFSGKTLSSDLDFLRGVIVDDFSASSLFLFSFRDIFFSFCFFFIYFFLYISFFFLLFL